MSMCALFLASALGNADSLPTVVATGATGGTGRLLYAQLKADSRIGEVRAVVRAGSGAKEKAAKKKLRERAECASTHADKMHLWIWGFVPMYRNGWDHEAIRPSEMGASPSTLSTP